MQELPQIALISGGIIEYTVSEISERIKRSLEDNFGYVCIRGEVSNFKMATSGHCYFNLKDQDAVIAATCWRHIHARLEFKPEEGMEILAVGKITTYSGQSKYQLSVEFLKPSGIGALMQILEKRRTMLAGEGLFDRNRKKPLPFFPSTIAVITSLSGAVIRDIIHRIKDRCPTRLIVWPVAVQGATSAQEVAEALYKLNDSTLLSEIKIDLIIVARGGGSIEDLWSFNEEIVVRAIAASKIPIISAIGHETDFTLADYAADLRAPTPTAAAELAVPVVSELRNSLSKTAYQLQSMTKKYIISKENILKLSSVNVSYLVKFLASYKQRFNHLSIRIYKETLNRFLLNSAKLKEYSISYLNPKKLIIIKSHALIAQKQKLFFSINQHLKLNLFRLERQIFCMQIHKLNSLYKRTANNIEQTSKLLDKYIVTYLNNAKESFTNKAQILEALSYKNTLKRGFAIIKSKKDNKLITRARDLSKIVTIQMYDGSLEAIIDESKK